MYLVAAIFLCNCYSQFYHPFLNRKVNGTGSRFCPMVGFCIIGVESAVSAASELVCYVRMCIQKFLD
jgi:hypothetical protein